MGAGHLESFYGEISDAASFLSHLSASRAMVTGGWATPARPCPQPLTSPRQKPVASATPTASARALPANAKQEGGKETLLQFPFPISPSPLHLKVLSRFQRRPRPPSIAKETGEDPAAQPGQVSRPTWLTCGASSYRLARPSPRAPALRLGLPAQTHPPRSGGREELGDPPRPLPRRTLRLLGRVCRCGLRSLFSTGAGGCEAGREGAEHVLPPGAT